jgi:hypothetical protein
MKRYRCLPGWAVRRIFDNVKDLANCMNPVGSLSEGERFIILESQGYRRHVLSAAQTGWCYILHTDLTDWACADEQSQNSV